MLKAVLFDMDGVLVDSEPEYRRIEKVLFRRVGIKQDEEDIKRNTGKGVLDMWIEAKEKYGFDEDPLLLMKEEARMISEYYQSDRLKPIKPALELLKSCVQSGLKTALATSSDEKNAKIIIEKLGVSGCLDAVAAGDMVERTKPSPDIFLLAAKLLNVSPDECVVIEDAINGIRAAKAAGMKTVGFKAPGSPQDLSSADIVVDSLGKINIDTLRALF